MEMSKLQQHQHNGDEEWQQQQLYESSNIGVDITPDVAIGILTTSTHNLAEGGANDEERGGVESTALTIPTSNSYEDDMIADGERWSNEFQTASTLATHSTDTSGRNPHSKNSKDILIIDDTVVVAPCHVSSPSASCFRTGASAGNNGDGPWKPWWCCYFFCSSRTPDSTEEGGRTASRFECMLSIFWARLCTLVVAIVMVSLLLWVMMNALDQRRQSDGNIKDTPNNNEDGEATYDRQAYYEHLIEVIFHDSSSHPFIQTGSPVARALEWMAFQDDRIVGSEKGSDDDDNNDSRNGNESSMAGLLSVHERLTQRFALLVWYFSLGGPQLWMKINQDRASGWVEYGRGVFECDWKGIDCNAHGQVTGLRLPGGIGMTLTGTSLPTELGMLTQLEQLDISNNRVQGSIPHEWETLTNLIIFNVGGNFLDSHLPSWLENLPRLRAFNVQDNSFSGIFPSEILNLKELEHIEIQINTDLQTSFQDLLVSLPHLVYLDVSRTNTTGTIPAVSMVPTTEDETVGTSDNYNDLLLVSKHLKVLRATEVALTGSIPTEIGSWTNLQELVLGDAPLTGTFPTELGSLTHLRTLEIKRVAQTMEGTLPTELGLLGHHLTTLDFRLSNRQGTLPVEYSAMTNLVNLDLAINDGITGTLPSEYAAMTSLRYVELMETSLTGVVSEEFCNIDFVKLEAGCLPLEYGVVPPKIECECCTHCYA